jgi:hypothetical protein
MQREEAKKLLEKINELSSRDLFIETYLKLAIVQAKEELGSGNASQEFIDDVIINKYLLNLAKDLLFIQTARVEALQSELAIYKSNGGC